MSIFGMKDRNTQSDDAFYGDEEKQLELLEKMKRDFVRLANDPGVRLGDTRQRKNKKFWWKRMDWALVLAVFGSAGYSFYLAKYFNITVDTWEDWVMLGVCFSLTFMVVYGVACDIGDRIYRFFDSRKK